MKPKSSKLLLASVTLAIALLALWVASWTPRHDPSIGKSMDQVAGQKRVTPSHPGSLAPQEETVSVTGEGAKAELRKGGQ